MKTKITFLIVCALFLASCSNMRYGSVPKAKKQKNTAIAVKHFKKKQQLTTTIAQKNVEWGVSSSQNLTVVQEDIVVAPRSIAQKQVKTNKEIQAAQKFLHPQQIQKVEKDQKQADTQELAKGSAVWYIVVGLVLWLIGGLLASIGLGGLGWLVVVVGTVAIIYGLLKLINIV